MKQNKKPANALPDHQQTPQRRPVVSFPDACTRKPTLKETTVERSGAEQCEIACIRIARYFFCNFSQPHSQSWSQAFSYAEEAFDYSNGPVIASLVSKVLQAVRRSRRSTFMYNNPSCENCARILTEHERRLLSALCEIRRGRLERADLELMLLCEGNDYSAATMWLRELALALPTMSEGRLN